MSPSAENTTPTTDTRPGEVRTYRGRTVEELIPRIRAELGPGAMILRERQGLTGGVGGFFAKRCVEIDAQAAPRLSVYADDEFETHAAAADPAAQFPGGAVSSPPAPAAPAPSARMPEATLPSTPVPAAAMPTTPMPEANTPHAPTPEATMPTTPMPEATAPHAPTPEATMPTTPMPEANAPEAAMPTTAEPQAAMPTAPMPETVAPEAAIEPEAPTSNVAVAPEAAVPSAGGPHASRPGVAAPNARTTPDPFAALLARWEQVAANNSFDPDATPDPFASVPSRAAVETPAPEAAEAPVAPEAAQTTAAPQAVEAPATPQAIAPAPAAPQATAPAPATESIPPATSLATQTAETVATPAPEQTAAPEPIAETQPVEETAAAVEPQAVAHLTPENGFIAFDELEAAPAAPVAPTSSVFRPVPVPMQSETAEAASMVEPAAAAPETSLATEAPATPEATITPDETITPEATATPDETITPEATITPDETIAPEATATPDETIAPEATITPDEITTPEATTTPDSDHASEAIGQTRLRNRLIDHGLSASLAERLVADAAEAAGSPSEPMLIANAQAALTSMLPKPEEMPVDGGVIAIVGPSGSGKTRVVAALAAASARQGYGVTVARLRGTQRDDELAELLEGEEVDLIPSMTIRAMVREVEAARGDLVILDTPATRVGDSWGLESLAETLARFLPDGVLLCTPATFTQKALAKLVEHHTPLQVDGLVATHYDQAGMLGTVVELAIETRIPLGHVHSGLDVTDAISAVDPHGLAGDLVR